MTTLNAHQTTIMLDRYAKRDKDGNTVEDQPEQVWHRVADEIGKDEHERQAFYNILRDFGFVPGGRILAGAGTESEKTYYNCFVIPVETKVRRQTRNGYGDAYDGWNEEDPGNDSREAIFDTMATMVDIMSRGGGVGINWSTLRPANAYLSRISGTSSGPVGWMDVASKAVGEVIQGGSRRGAAMFMMNDWHPDVLKFIQAKETAGKIENANISVAVGDNFMDAVNRDEDWEFIFPDTSHKAYNTEWDGDLRQWINKGYPFKVYGTVRARDMWAQLASSAWRSGEPGVVFIDRYNEQSTAREVERIISVNPCGEQGLGAYSVCNLGSMNLAAYMVGHAFDWTRFRADVRVAVRFLDNVIDKTHYLHRDSREQQRKLRRIGLGVMGLADALIMRGFRYGSSDAVRFTEQIFSAMKDEAIKASMGLAAERGPAGAWKDSMWERPYLAEFAKRHQGYNLTPLRNLFLLTQAPTGTTASFAGVNSGIEPYFSFKYTRKDRTGTHVMQSDIVSKAAHPDALATSNDLTPAQHLVMQAAAQRFIDSSVSKTINAPKDASEASVLEAYTMAYDLGLKGLAYYRDGSREVQVLYHAEQQEKVEQPAYSAHPGIDFDKSTLPMIAFASSGNSDVCPSCTGTVVRQEGCSKCLSCSWSAC